MFNIGANNLNFVGGRMILRNLGGQNGELREFCFCTNKGVELLKYRIQRNKLEVYDGKNWIESDRSCKEYMDQKIILLAKIFQMNESEQMALENKENKSLEDERMINLYRFCKMCLFE